MACRGSGFSLLGLVSLGASLSGFGLANMAKSITGSLPGFAGISGQMGGLGTMLEGGLTSSFSSVSGMISGGLNPLSFITSEFPGILQSVGSSLGDGLGFITGALGDGFELIGGTGFVDGLSAHATELFGPTLTEAFQTFNPVEAFSALSQNIASSVTDAFGAEFGQAISALTKALPIDGDFGNFLGAGIPDMQAMVTNGLSTLTNSVIDIPGFAGDLIKVGGAFDLADIANFGNPGQIVSKLITAGAGDITGITAALQKVGLGDFNQITNLASGQFNGVLNDALGLITNPEMIRNAQAILGSDLKGLTSMADFTDLSKVLQVSFDDIPFDTFGEFGEQLSSLNLGSMSTAMDLGNVLNAITTVDLPTILNATVPADYNALTTVVEKFLGGSGQNGAIKASDLMGTLGGIGLTTPFNLYKVATTEMDDLGAFDTLRDMYSELTSGMQGNYLDVIGDAAASTIITDPRDGSIHTDLTSFVSKKILNQIAPQVTDIAGNSTWSGAFGTARSAWQSMQEHTKNEKIHAAKTDLQLGSRTDDPENIYHFIANMVPRAAKTDVIAIVDGMADAAVEATGIATDRFGEYWKALIAESKNQNVVDPYDVYWRTLDNTETKLV